MPTSYYYPPVFWSLSSRFDTHCRDEMKCTYIKTALLPSVSYPRAKVMLWQRADFATGRATLNWSDPHAKTPIALVDGSCETQNMSDLYAATERDGELIPTETCCRPYAPSPIYPFYWATLHGIKVRDLPR